MRDLPSKPMWRLATVADSPRSGRLGVVPEPLASALSDLRSQLLDTERLVRAVGSGRQRGQAPRWRRVEVRPVDLASGPHLQLTTYDDTQAFTRNVAPGDAAGDAVDELLAEPLGNWHVETRDAVTQLRVTKKGAAQVHIDPRQAESEGLRTHDRPKQRMLDGSDPYLLAVGIADRSGGIKPSRRAKYRQIEEFCRQLAAALDGALDTGTVRTTTPDDPLRVVDLGCGNAYLTFAAYRWLSAVRGLPVRFVGVDVKEQARRRNSELAEELGSGDGLRFVRGDIATATVGDDPDVVLTLHACDTATDDALARAVTWQAPLILAAPCCHHDLQRRLRSAPTPQPFGLVTRHGILRERLADTLTDAMRAALLRMRGYRVDVVEFVGSKHTPRNTMLRAVRTGSTGDPAVASEYADLIAQWRVRPRLAELLEDAS
jgi:SAM-dependent methyltransferase